MNAIKKNEFLKWGIAALIVSLHVWLLFFIPRSHFVGTYLLFLGYFAAYYFVVRKEQLFSFSFCIALAVLLRLIAVFSLPALSDDYFRFIWDGKMVMNYINPFQYSPQEFMQTYPHSAYLQYLYANMNSQEYHSVYPAVLQYIFSTAVFLFPENAYGSVIVMKMFILLAECFSMRMLYLYARKKGIAARAVLWYILNPMIIIELTGNVHFEAVMLCFLVAAFYWMEQKNLLLSAVCWSLAIASKMIPLMLAPVFLRFLGLKGFFRYGMVAAIMLVLLFLPFINTHLFTDINTSLRLFYHLFEFNGSIFYFIRWLGYRRVHYDIIETTAPVLGLISFLIILLISFWPSKKFSVTNSSLWIIFVYFLFATMVHPWYAASLVMLCVVTRYRFPLAFSLLILLSYYGYSLKEYDESNWIILVEYGLLFAFMGTEYFSFTKLKRQ